ncbi:MAG: hypothetical protein FXF54_10930 [Kosmotoga sp.]|nr:MAG: hypothetical protein FXF54_10930 [Kosmotoga sp.]
MSKLKRNKGTGVLLVTVTLIIAISTVMSFHMISVISQTNRIAESFLNAAVKRATVISAKKILEFSIENKINVETELNGYVLKSFNENGVWYVSLEGHGIYEKITRRQY